MLVGVSQGVCAVVSVGHVASDWAWARASTVGSEGVVGGMWACHLSGVTVELFQVLPWAWHGVKGETMAANVAEHTTGKATKV